MLHSSHQLSRKPRHLSGAYRRWKRQLEALMAGDLITVHTIASEAKYELEMKRERNLRLPFIQAKPYQPYQYDHRRGN